jgi:hypothetical protein
MTDMPIPVMVFKGIGLESDPHSGNAFARKIIPTSRKKNVFNPTRFRVSLNLAMLIQWLVLI